MTAKPSTPSQRLRGALFILYELDDHPEPFEEWYDDKMKHFIAAVSKAIKDKESQNIQIN